MAKPIGPTVPRRRLGEQLAALRESAGLSQPAVARRLGCSVSKLQKVEAGDVGLAQAELLLMLDTYGVTAEAVRERLRELQQLGKERGWWSKLGPLPAAFTTYLGMETAATGIRIFEPLVVPELLRTRAYAEALGTPDQLVEIMLERQRRLFAGPAPPTLTVILDEAVLRRPVGGPEGMAEQLDRLSTQAVHVVPLAAGAHAGLRGPITLFDFEEGMHSPVGYTHTWAGAQYVQKPDLVTRCQEAFATLVTLSVPLSSLVDLGGAR